MTPHAPSTASVGQAGQPLVVRLFAPVDIGWLVYFRVCFGLLAAWLMWMFFSSGAIERHYILPKLHFTYYGFEWVQPWPGNGMYWHFAGLVAAAVCIAFGVLTRVSCLLFGVGFAYVFLLEQARYMNHFYLLVLISLLLAFVPAGRAFSIDALLHPQIRSKSVPTWCLRLFQIQIGLVYLFAGVAKLDADWLQGAPLALMLADRTDAPLIGAFFTERWMIMLMSYGSLLFDLLAFPMLMWRPTRVAALVLSAGFHLMNSQIFHIDVFPWFMLAATVILFFPDWLPYPRRDDSASKARQLQETTPRLDVRQRLTLGLLGLYLLVQFLVPLRHLLYPGNANWTNQGNRFAWRMLLRHKAGYPPAFLATYRKGGQVQDERLAVPTDPEFWWRHWQYRKMITNPDMILQFCHKSARELEQQGCEDVDIRAHVLVSLNGRTPQYLVDPNVNLAAQPRNLWSADWIVPLTQPLPEK